jgi:DNA replication initiation complex subunit (GINS family)
MEVTTEQLYNILQSEKKTGELLPLPKEFYKYAEQYLKGLEPSSEDKPQMITNFRKLLLSIKEKRTQKLLIYIAYNKQLPTQIPEEEEDLYKKIKNILEGTDHSQKLKKLKINVDMPEIIMPNGNKIGPFKQNQIVESAAQDEVEFLINNKLCELS